MSGLKVRKPTKEELQQMKIETWSSWSCNPSTFDWDYSETETAFVKEGRVTVKHDGGETEIEAGDLVTFPKGMKCVWTVHETIRKVFTFEPS